LRALAGGPSTRDTTKREKLVDEEDEKMINDSPPKGGDIKSFNKILPMEPKHYHRYSVSQVVVETGEVNQMPCGELENLSDMSIVTLSFLDILTVCIRTHTISLTRMN
jgi:hypothetical protein